MDRFDWVLGDTATWADLGWLTIAPFTGGLIGLLPLLLIAVPVGIGLPLWFCLPVAALGWWIAPHTLRVAARFHRFMLGRLHDPSTMDTPVRRWVHRNAPPVLKLAVLLLSSVLALLAFVATLLGFALAYGLGLFFFVLPLLESLHGLASWRRRRAAWSGVTVADPYRPLPPVIRRSDDGLYQVGKTLYQTRRWAAWASRVERLLRDPATWREALWRGLDPIVGGGIAMDPEVIAKLLAKAPANDPVDTLTERERDVLALMAEGRSNAAITQRLFISEGSVTKHTASILGKLGLAQSDDDNRRVLAVLAYLNRARA